MTAETRLDEGAAAEKVAATEARPRGERIRVPLLTGAGALAMCVAINVHDPNNPGSWGTCPFLALTGYTCPGCGMLRATRALFHGDVDTALGRNPLIFVVLPLLAVVWIMWMRSAWSGRAVKRALPLWLSYLIFGALVAFGILRNVPGFAFLGPGPL